MAAEGHVGAELMGAAQKGEGRAAVEFDDGPYARARLGFICVANAGLIEGDMFAMRPPGVGLGFTRVRMQQECTIESLAAMEGDLDDALGAFVPARADIDVICYNCTAGSFVIGEDVIRDKIEAGRPGVRGTTLLNGVVEALRIVDAKRVAIATAYTPDIDALEHAYFTTRGFDVTIIQGLGLITDVEMNKVSPRFLASFAESVDSADADAIFISCGALRALEIVDAVERKAGKPVVTSNQASFWHSLRLAGIDDRIPGYGRLLSAF